MKGKAKRPKGSLMAGVDSNGCCFSNAILITSLIILNILYTMYKCE